ncbi:hypothetical protein AeMF1_005388 [Aphanomyces euteiches]|nr:hypothetical protein AeMF1_005388 [Aphanomyces euteiches]KAH9183692.1 hypothetical protein AeNC1_014332 [Aphanomyces euteiches]
MFYRKDSFYYWVAYMSDAIEVVNQLSKSLQAETMNVIAVLPVVLATINQLTVTFTASSIRQLPSSTSLRQCHADLGDRLVLHKTKELCDMHDLCSNFVTRLVQALKDRFPEDSQQIISALSALYPSSMMSCDNLALFGIDRIETLVDHY